MQKKIFNWGDMQHIFLLHKNWTIWYRPPFYVIMLELQPFKHRFLNPLCTKKLKCGIQNSLKAHFKIFTMHNVRNQQINTLKPFQRANKTFISLTLIFRFLGDLIKLKKRYVKRYTKKRRQ